MNKLSLSIKRADLLYIFSLFIFYGLGFILDENSSGGSKIDFHSFHYPTVLHFYNNRFFEAIQDYSSASTPLFYLINAYLNPFVNNTFLIRFSNLLFNLGIVYLFYKTLKIKYKDISHFNVLILSLILVISPYFKSAAIWATNDNLPYFFLILSAYILEKNNYTPIIRHSILILALTVLAALTRQYYIIFVFYFLALIITHDIKNRKNNALLISITVLLFIPFAYLFYIWKGLTPPSFQHHTHISLYSLPYIFTFIAFYSIPYIVQIVKDLKNSNKLTLKNIIPYILIGCLYLIAFENFTFYADGGGFIVKVLLLIDNSLGLQISKVSFLIFGMLGFLFSIYLMSLSKYNFIIIFSLLFLISTNIIFQKYADPLLNLVLLLFINYQQHYPSLFKNKAFVVTLLAFNLSFYVIAFTYYNIYT